MAYHPEQWYKIGGTYITPNDDVGIKLTSDVYINFGDLYGSPGYGLRDDSGTMQFKNDGGAWSNLGSGTGGGASALSDLTDVDASVASPSDGDIMVYRSSGNDWVLESKPAGGSNPAIADITDVTITSVSDDEVLAYDTTSGEFINQTAAEAGLAAASHNHTASEISDFDTEVSNNTDVAANTSDRHSAATVTDTPTVDLTISGQDIQGDVISQMSVTSDASGIKLESDEVSPGNNKVYGTDGTGNKGWQDGGGGGNTYFNNESIDQSGGTSDTHGVLSGTLDGTNTTFTVSSGAYTTGTLSVYLNGQLLTQGSSEDWTETTPASGTFDFVTAPQSSDEITVAYQENELSSESVITDATTNVSATSWVLDEDTLVSDSDTKVPTQQSVKAYVDANSGGGGYTDEEAQDAVGTILTDTTEIDLTYSDATPSITADIKTGSVVSTKLATAVQTSLGKADSATQPADIANFETTTELNARDTANRSRANHTGTQTASTISDFDTEVANNSAVTANTAKVSYTDSAKVAGIEAGADVTDTTNVTAAGALMDSEVTNLAQVKAFDSTDYATAAQGSTADSAVQDTGDETIAGIKTFSSSPIVPAPTTDLQAATKKYVDDNGGGGDLWSDDVDSDIIPDGDNTRDIGSPSAIFSQVHSRSVFTANLVAETTNMGMLNNNDDAIVAFYAPDNAVNYVRFVASLTGVAAKIEANSDVDANVDINLVPKGTGTVQANGEEVATVSDAQTLTNKRITRREQTVASASTVTPHWDNDDIVTITAQAVGLTLANPAGTPTDGQPLVIRILDNGTGRTIAVGSQYRAIGVTIPTTTTASKTIYLGGFWNVADSKFDITAVAEEA